MRSLCRLALGATLSALFVSPVVAQTQSTSQQQPAQQQTSASDRDTRPATTTTIGDTGLWFVPLGEVLPRGRWSASAYRVNWDRTEAFSDISDFRGTFAFGATDRLEIFGGLTVQRRIDADFRPPRAIGTPMDYPTIVEGWQTGFGDIILGGKFNLTSQWENDPFAFAIRGALKVPTASDSDGLGSGKVDILVDGVLSSEVNQAVDLSGYVGLQFRGDADDFDQSHGLRYGGGFGWPSRSPLRLIGELTGEYYFDNTVTYTGTNIVGNELPLAWDVHRPLDAHIGVTWQTPAGFFAGAGLSFAFNQEGRSTVPGSLADDEGGDYLGFQARIGYHPGVRIYVPPPPPPPPPPPAAPANRPPTVKARCEPCTVEVGKASTVTADAQDPDGDTLTYKWSAPTGSFANPADRQTIFTCPPQEGAVPVTVTVSDGKGGTASDTITIQCVRPPRKQYTFEDVHFDFDRYTLRPEATRILDEAIKAMQEDPELRLTVEGHTCNIGTAEYNLALGERRANAVRDYLTSRGVTAARLQSVSYGEERPKHDNAREETRRLNRRAALTIRLQ
jgi:outer membrane protein OmpA-like peptidoglycan-associated protein